MNYSIKLDLSKLKNVFIKDIQGTTQTKKCLCIPLEDAGLFTGTKGIYLDLNCREIDKDKQQYNTHLIVQNFTKEIYNKMSEEEKKNLPIVGNLKPFEKKTILEENNEVPF